jgi:hypothetical protein
MNTFGGEQQTDLCHLSSLRNIPRACDETACRTNKDPVLHGLLTPAETACQSMLQCINAAMRGSSSNCLITDFSANWRKIVITLIDLPAQFSKSVMACLRQLPLSKRECARKTKQIWARFSASY